jgi:hypothetical protein
MGRISFAKLTVAPSAGGCVAGGSVGAAVSVGDGASVGASVAGATTSVGAEVGVLVGCVPQADNNPTIKTNRTNFTYADFIIYLLLKRFDHYAHLPSRVVSEKAHKGIKNWDASVTIVVKSHTE